LNSIQFETSFAYIYGTAVTCLAMIQTSTALRLSIKRNSFKHHSYVMEASIWLSYHVT
jgi:hypothetical protein